jgi:hypothetical protein
LPVRDARVYAVTLAQHKGLERREVFARGI